MGGRDDECRKKIEIREFFLISTIGSFPGSAICPLYPSYHEQASYGWVPTW
jgi:hypothetical protein